MSLKQLDWEIDPATRSVVFTITQDIALQPIKFAIPFEFFANVTKAIAELERNRRKRIITA